MGEADQLGTDRTVVHWWRSGWARSVYVVTGMAFGSAVSLTSASRGTERWLVWAALAISLTAASGAVFGYGLARWPEIAASHHPRRRWVVVYLARVYGAALGMLMLAAVLSIATQQGASLVTGGSVRGPLLVSFAGLATLPVVAGLGAIYEHAQILEGTIGERVETVLRLRRLLAGILAALGSQVTLATLALGAARQIGADQPNAVVLVFGAAWSGIIAIAYAPAAGTLRTAARELCHMTVPLANVEPRDLPARTEQRDRLEQALGVDRGLLADIQSGILVLSPLLASAASLLLPN
jgi:hypothetical protein